VPLSPQTLLNVFLDGLLFKYKRDILLQGISNYDDALKRAVLLERLDTTETVGKVVAELACNQSSASSAVELENITGTFTNFKAIESSVNELKESVAALSMRDSYQVKTPEIQSNFSNTELKVNDETNRSQTYNNSNSRFQNNSNNNNQQRSNNQQGQKNNSFNRNYHGNNFDPNFKYNKFNQQRPRFNNSQNQQKSFNNQNGQNNKGQNYSQNQFNRGRGTVRSNNNSVGSFTPTCFFCGKRGHFSTFCFLNPSSDQYRQSGDNFRQNNNSFRPVGQNSQQYGQQQQPIYVQMPIPQGYQQQAIQQLPYNQPKGSNIQYIPVVQNESSQSNNQIQNSGN
jgi:hypothetical protein